MGVILGIISGTIIGVRKGYTRTIAHMVVGDLFFAGASAGGEYTVWKEFREQINRPPPCVYFHVCLGR